MNSDYYEQYNELNIYIYIAIALPDSLLLLLTIARAVGTNAVVLMANINTSTINNIYEFILVIFIYL